MGSKKKRQYVGGKANPLRNFYTDLPRHLNQLLILNSLFHYSKILCVQVFICSVKWFKIQRFQNRVSPVRINKPINESDCPVILFYLPATIRVPDVSMLPFSILGEMDPQE